MNRENEFNKKSYIYSSYNLLLYFVKEFYTPVKIKTHFSHLLSNIITFIIRKINVSILENSVNRTQENAAFCR